MATRVAALLYVAAAALAAGIASADVRGVPKSQQHLYQRNTFVCDSGKEIPISQVNDEFCDCNDGTDEPGTSACPEGQFYCINKGHRGQYITSSLVNDGVCDCCDGSDEYSSGAKCPDICDVVGRQARQEQEERIRTIEAGARKKKEYIQFAEQALKEKRESVESLQKELDEARTALEEAKNKEEELRQSEHERRAAASSDSIQKAIDGLRLNELNDAQLRTLVVAMLKNNDQDATALLSLVRASLRGENPIAVTDFPSEVSEEDKMNVEFEYVEGDAAESQELVMAKAETESASSKEKQLASQLRDVENTLSEDFGKQNEWYKLKDQCFEVPIQQYRYKLCLFGKAYQDSTVLGTFRSWGEDRSTMLYDGGARCWNGPERSITVTLECGAEESFTKVEEPSKCEYSGVFTSPAACDVKHAEELNLDLEMFRVDSSGDVGSAQEPERIYRTS